LNNTILKEAAMSTPEEKPLLLRFHSSGGHLAAKRSTLQECARIMGVSETRAAHIAINQLWLKLSGQETTDFDFPKGLPERAPTKAESQAIKQSLSEFFEKTVPRP
jgi:hypothetical protein